MRILIILFSLIVFSCSELGFLNIDLYLDSSSTVKGEFINDFGTPSSDILKVKPGFVNISYLKAETTTNDAASITLFNAKHELASVKVVKYSKDASFINFEKDTSYDNSIIEDKDFFVVRIRNKNTNEKLFYIIVVNVIKNLSNEKRISSFIIKNQVGDTIIVEDNSTITITMPFNTLLDSLTPTIQIIGKSIYPESLSPQDFNSPLIYTVTAYDNSTRDYTVYVELSDLVSGDIITYNIDNISFNMIYVEGGLSFPTEDNDNIISTVANPYLIAETELTYELWYEVKAWATHTDRLWDIYTFANPGKEGSMGTDGAIPSINKNHPVTFINWRDAIIFCNALTEWYNYKFNSNLVPYYKNNASFPLRTASNSNILTLLPGTIDNPLIDTSADGFRLATNLEWELAARWSDNSINTVAGYTNPFFTLGFSASGATDIITNIGATDLVAWFEYNSNNTTHEVKQKSANSLGLYDMSGNVREWVFNWHPSTSNSRSLRGGAYNTPYNVGSEPLRLSYIESRTPHLKSNNLGFRIVKNNLLFN